MTSARLPLVKTQRSFLSGIRLSTQLHGPKVKVTAPPIKKRKFRTLWVLALRHVMLPKEIAKLVPKTHLMSETEWRGLGVQQSQGWIHYMRHEPEPHILLFRRPVTTN